MPPRGASKSEGAGRTGSLVALLPIEGSTDEGERFAFAPGEPIEERLLDEEGVALLLAGPDPAAVRVP